MKREKQNRDFLALNFLIMQWSMLMFTTYSHTHSLITALVNGTQTVCRFILVKKCCSTKTEQSVGERLQKIKKGSSEGDSCMCVYDSKLTEAIVLAGDTIKAGQTEGLLNVRQWGEWQRWLKHEATTAVHTFARHLGFKSTTCPHVFRKSYPMETPPVIQGFNADWPPLPPHRPCTLSLFDWQFITALFL